jgi:hypothetical protein
MTETELDELKKEAEAFRKAYEVMRKWGYERDISAYQYNLDGLFYKIVKHLKQAESKANAYHQEDMSRLGLIQGHEPHESGVCCPCCSRVLLKAEPVRINQALPYASKQDDIFHINNQDALTAFICLNCSRVYVPKVK